MNLPGATFASHAPGWWSKLVLDSQTSEDKFKNISNASIKNEYHRIPYIFDLYLDSWYLTYSICLWLMPFTLTDLSLSLGSLAALQAARRNGRRSGALALAVGLRRRRGNPLPLNWVVNHGYPLVNWQLAIEKWIFSLKMVIFHSYVSLPEDNHGISHWNGDLMGHHFQKPKWVYGVITTPD